MPTQDSLEQTEIGELIVSVDDGRAAGDAFKLGTGLRALVVVRVADLKTKDATTFITEGGRAGASLAGSSTSTTVSVVGLGLLTPGVTYTKCRR